MNTRNGERTEETRNVSLQSIVEFVCRQDVRALVAKLRRAGVRMASERVARTRSANVAGKTFVVTGTLAGYSRDEIQDLVKSLGGRAASSVSNKTDYVIVGKNPGSKLDKARQLGVKMLTEREFVEMISG